VSRRRLRRHWERHAAADPLWAVAATPEGRGGGWDEKAFFASGVEEIAAALARLDRLGLPPRRARALDFGCGVGRLSQALADQFETVDGIDIAPTMVDLARRANRHGDRCRYHVAREEALPFPDHAFDLVYSVLVLQHMPPPLARRALRELARVVAPGGALVFQQAAEPRPLSGDARWSRRPVVAVKELLPARLVAAIKELKHALGGTRGFEMYGLPRGEVEGILEANALRLVEVTPDEAAGEGWTSFSYVATREAPRAPATTTP